MNDGKYSTGNTKPIKNDFVKLGFGNNNNPTINPRIIEIYAFFSVIFLL